MTDEPDQDESEEREPAEAAQAPSSASRDDEEPAEPGPRPESDADASDEAPGADASDEAPSHDAPADLTPSSTPSEIKAPALAAKPVWWRRAALPFAVWAISALVYCLVAGPRLSGPTPDNHFVHLANSFLHGQLGVIDNTPPGTNDWACFDTDTGEVCPPGCFYRPSESYRWYISFPPLPAIMIMPAVAIWGLDTRDALFWALFAGLSPAFLFLLLRMLREEKKSDRTLTEDLLLTALFAFGSVFFFTSVQGTVWFAGHVVACALLPLYLLFSWDARKPLWAGLMLGLLFLTRPTTAVLVIFFALEAARMTRGDAEGAPAESGIYRRAFAWLHGVRWGQALPKMAVFAAPILVMGGVAMWMNEARFGDPFEFGHRFLVIRWIDRIETWGLFSYHYLARNLAVFTSSLPWFTRDDPHVIISRHGLALWFTTPALLWVFFPKKVTPSMVALMLGTFAVCLWNLLYQNTGWVQFGYRFALDYMVPLVVLIALGGRRFRSGFITMLVFAIAVNLFGAITFDRAWQYYDDDGTQQRFFHPD